MEEIAPEAVTVAARLSRPERACRSRLRGASSAPSRAGQMRLAPLHIENFLLAVGERARSPDSRRELQGASQAGSLSDPGLDGTEGVDHLRPMLGSRSRRGEEKYLASAHGAD